MWEDAAANSVGGGGIDGIGVGAKGEPGVHMKKKKKNKKELLKRDIKLKTEAPRTNKDLTKGDWEHRHKLQRNVRTKMWKSLGKKLKRK